MEPVAVKHFERKIGLDVHRTGFIVSDEYMAGCSLDGHTGGRATFDSILEIKWPQKHHARLLLARESPAPGVHAQVTHNLWDHGGVECLISLASTTGCPRGRSSSIFAFRVPS